MDTVDKSGRGGKATASFASSAVSTLAFFEEVRSRNSEVRRAFEVFSCIGAVMLMSGHAIF